MNVESIARKALTILKLKWGIPKFGFLAGGSIANTMWEIVSGNKAALNDIDIFLHQGNNFKKNKPEKSFEIKKFETVFFEDYQQLSFYARVSESESFSILESTKDGILNFVKYESKCQSPKIIIDSFDINCTQIGYSIEEDKFYWTEDFAEFLKTGELKITNLNTPAHSAIRIVKKKKDLNAKLNHFEIELLNYVLDRHISFADINRVRFKEKYQRMFLDNADYLGNYFMISKDEFIMEYLQKKEIYDDIFTLTSINADQFILKYGDMPDRPSVLSEFLFYIRNIHQKEEKSERWNKIKQLYVIKDYLSNDNTEEEINFISNFIKSYPLTINQLRGLTLSQQYKLVNNILNSTKDLFDYETAIKILENHKFYSDSILDDEDLLLLELSVRKKPSNKKAVEI
jgi:hypothetical protein